MLLLSIRYNLSYVAAWLCLFIFAAGCTFFSSSCYPQTCILTAPVRGPPTVVGFCPVRNATNTLPQTDTVVRRRFASTEGSSPVIRHYLWLRVAAVYNKNITTVILTLTLRLTQSDPINHCLALAYFVSHTVFVNHTRYQRQIRRGALCRSYKYE